MLKKEHSERSLVLILCLVLVVAILAVYWQVKDHEFVTYDDYEYVAENPYVRSGLTREGILWAFTSTRAGNWHPLSWMSHMLDCELYGLNPSGHHWNSALLHMGNSLILFLLLRRMTRTLWRSFLVAGLFALHPLHVESVAWVSERKDVLSAFFWLSTLWAYVLYAERHSPLRYGLTLFLFLLGLTAKPMVVTLPLVMLLLDYWPLNRFRSGPSLLPEKIPFFALSLVSSVLTLLTQKTWGAVHMQIPFSERLANAFFSYGSYLLKVFWPSPLSFYYTHPLDSLSPAQVLGPLILLGLVTYASIRYSSKIPYLTVGWLWYLVTLLPVIGLIQVGSQGMADRYTYLPLIGPFLVLAWGTAHLATRWHRLRGPLTVIWACWMPVLVILSWLQAGKWKDSLTLYQHAIRVDSRNVVAQFNLGNVYARLGRMAEAERHIREALRLKPDYAPAHNNLANVLVRLGRTEEGVLHYQEALRLQPDFPQAGFNLDLALKRLSQGKGGGLRQDAELP